MIRTIFLLTMLSECKKMKTLRTAETPKTAPQFDGKKSKIDIASFPKEGRRDLQTWIGDRNLPIGS